MGPRAGGRGRAARPLLAWKRVDVRGGPAAGVRRTAGGLLARHARSLPRAHAQPDRGPDDVLRRRGDAGLGGRRRLPEAGGARARPGGSVRRSCGAGRGRRPADGRIAVRPEQPAAPRRARGTGREGGRARGAGRPAGAERGAALGRDRMAPGGDRTAGCHDPVRSPRDRGRIAGSGVAARPFRRDRRSALPVQASRRRDAGMAARGDAGRRRTRRAARNGRRNAGRAEPRPGAALDGDLGRRVAERPAARRPRARDAVLRSGRRKRLGHLHRAVVPGPGELTRRYDGSERRMLAPRPARAADRLLAQLRLGRVGRLRRTDRDRPRRRSDAAARRRDLPRGRHARVAAAPRRISRRDLRRRLHQSVGWLARQTAASRARHHTGWGSPDQASPLAGAVPVGADSPRAPARRTGGSRKQRSARGGRPRRGRPLPTRLGLAARNAARSRRQTPVAPAAGGRVAAAVACVRGRGQRTRRRADVALARRNRPVGTGPGGAGELPWQPARDRVRPQQQLARLRGRPAGCAPQLRQELGPGRRTEHPAGGARGQLHRNRVRRLRSDRGLAQADPARTEPLHRRCDREQRLGLEGR